MYEAFLKASIPSSEPYNKALLKLSYYISFNMNIPFSPSFNPDDYLPFFQLQSNKFISETLYGYSYIDRGDFQSYILLHKPINRIK
jgi:hypothetical protein